MSGDIRALTGIALVAPLGLVLGAALAREPVRGTLLSATVFVVVVYAAVWFLGRPTAFEVDVGGLWIRWPLRSRHIAAGDIAGAEMLSREAFRRDFGWGIRIGAGGLWGGFGWLYTRKGLLDLYVSHGSPRPGAAPRGPAAAPDTRARRGLRRCPADPQSGLTSARRWR